jgi:hypothetical protein
MSSVSLTSIRAARLRVIDAKYAVRVAQIEFDRADEISAAVRYDELAYENLATRQLVQVDWTNAKTALKNAELELKAATSELKLARLVSRENAMARFNTAGERLFHWVERLFN